MGELSLREGDTLSYMRPRYLEVNRFVSKLNKDSGTP